MVEKLARLFAGEVERLAPLLARWHSKLKYWNTFGMLARWRAKLNNGHAFGTLACLLAHWHVKMRSWHAFGTLARGHVDHAGKHGTHGTRFRKLEF